VSLQFRPTSSAALEAKASADRRLGNPEQIGSLAHNSGAIEDRFAIPQGVCDVHAQFAQAAGFPMFTPKPALAPHDLNRVVVFR